jgi:translation initiation factor IF-3
LAHTEIGRAVLTRILGILADTAVMERRPQMEGRFMSMFLSPGPAARALSQAKREADNAKDQDT